MLVPHCETFREWRERVWLPEAGNFPDPLAQPPPCVEGAVGPGIHKLEQLLPETAQRARGWGFSLSPMLTLGLRAVTCLVTQQHHVIMLRQGARRGHRVKLMECWTSVSCSKPTHLPSIPWTLICQAVFLFTRPHFSFQDNGPGDLYCSS